MDRRPSWISGSVPHSRGHSSGGYPTMMSVQPGAPPSPLARNGTRASIDLHRAPTLSFRRAAAANGAATNQVASSSGGGSTPTSPRSAVDSSSSVLELALDPSTPRRAAVPSPWGWVAAFGVCLALYVAVLTFSALSLPPPSYGTAANGTDGFITAGWGLYVLGLSALVAATIATAVKRHPYFPAILVAYFTSLGGLVAAAVCHTSRLSVDPLSVGSTGAVLAAQIAWVANTLFFALFSVMLSRGARVTVRGASREEEDKYAALLNIREMALRKADLTRALGEMEQKRVARERAAEEAREAWVGMKDAERRGDHGATATNTHAPPSRGHTAAGGAGGQGMITPAVRNGTMYGEGTMASSAVYPSPYVQHVFSPSGVGVALEYTPQQTTTDGYGHPISQHAHHFSSVPEVAEDLLSYREIPVRVHGTNIVRAVSPVTSPSAGPSAPATAFVDHSQEMQPPAYAYDESTAVVPLSTDEHDDQPQGMTVSEKAAQIARELFEEM